MNTLSEIKDKLFYMRSGMDYQETPLALVG
jgi:hypothetical protein